MKRLFVLIIVLAATSSMGAVPRIVNYQGFIMESPDGPPVNGNLDLIFGVYSDSLGGAALWSENHLQVPVTLGVFNVNLGELQPFPTNLFADGNKWLDVYVPNFASGLPRVRLTSVVWALHASVADTALNFYGDIPEHDHSLDDLSDVTAPMPSPGEALTWDGTGWLPALPGAGYDEPRIAGHLNIPGGSISTNWTVATSKEFLAPSDGYVLVYGEYNSNIYLPDGPYHTSQATVTVAMTKDGEELKLGYHTAAGNNVNSWTVVVLQAMTSVTAGVNTFAISSRISHGEYGNTFGYTDAAIWVMFFPASTSDVTVIE